MQNRVIGGVLVVLVVVSACGGSKSSDSAASDFCAKAQGAHDALNGFDTIGELEDPSAVKAVFTTAIDAVGAARELSPESLRNAFSTVLKGLSDLNDLAAGKNYDLAAIGADPRFDEIANEQSFADAGDKISAYLDPECGIVDEDAESS